jgi:NAD(P)-dependent dehydrogenase (short-subunit alcohol dehydrogenase family)
MTGRRVAVVTGATAGIGLGVATAFGQAGYSVIGAGRRVDHGLEVQGRLRGDGVDFTFVGADVSDVAATRELIETASTTHGRIDVLVNNAGTVGPDPAATFDEIDEAAFDLTLSTNLKAPFFTAQAAARVMRAHGGGAIINVGSAAGELIGGDLLPYRAAKAGLMFLSRCLADTLEPVGIAVHTVVMYRVASDGGRRTTEARIARQGLDPADAQVVRDEYESGAVQPDDVGAAFVAMVERPGVLIGPGFVVRP